MPRRSRTRGASGSSTTKRPPVATPEAQREYEAVLDEVYDAIMVRDSDRLASAMDQVTAAPPFAPELITRRLIEGRERASGIMLTILAEIADDRWERYLERIVKARDAQDQVRYEAQRMLGWEPHRELQRRRGFLKTLRDPYGALATSTNSAGLTWPARVEALSDVVGYLGALQPPARYEALERILKEAGWNALPLLHGLVHAADPVVQRKAIDALVEQRCSASPGPLRRLLATTHDGELRQYVADVLRKVAFDRTSAPDTDEPMFPASGLNPLYWARVTRVRPDGDQSLWITRQVGESLYDATHIFITGKSGLSEVNQYGPMPDEILEEDVLAIEAEVAPWTTIDLAVARGLAEYAIDRFAQTGMQAPFLFELYEPVLHDTYPPAPDEPVIVPILDDAPFAGRADLVARGLELLDHPLFNAWAFGIDHVMMGLTLEQPPGPDAADTEVNLSLARQLLNPAARAVLRDALRRQAWLLEASGNEDERDIALALAAWLPDAGDEDLADNAFVVTLAQFSIGETARMFGGPALLSDLADLDEDWLADADLDEIDADSGVDDGSIEADWSVVPEEGQETPTGE